MGLLFSVRLWLHASVVSPLQLLGDMRTDIWTMLVSTKDSLQPMLCSLWSSMSQKRERQAGAELHQLIGFNMVMLSMEQKSDEAPPTFAGQLIAVPFLKVIPHPRDTNA